MKGIFTKIINYLKYSILNKSIKISMRLIYSPIYFLIDILYNSFFYLLNNKKNIEYNDRLNGSNINLLYYFQRKKWIFFFQNKFFYFIDLIYVLFLGKSFLRLNNIFNLRIKVRLKQVNWSFYNNLHSLTNKNTFFNYYFVHYLSGLRFIWIGLKYWLIGLILGLSSFYYLTYIRLLPFNKIIFEWILVIMFLYWLLSGFVFFIKKYQYSKFTTVIQRFWKRSYILFWLLESGVFVVFFFLTMNASDEPLYMYDQAKLFKTHLFSWRLFLLKIIPVVSMVILGYYLLLSLKWTNFSKQTPLLVLLTLILIYVFWLEFYQFFHIISYYGSLIWSFDTDEFLWNLDIDFKRTRIINNLTTICLLAKFWHLVFIFVFWVFFLLRINEIGRVRYPLLAANLQNFIILYIMSWLYMFPWLKFGFRRHLETQYYWFFYSIRRLGIRVFLNDLIIFYISLLKNFSFNNLFYFNSGLFYYWFGSSNNLGSLQYKKFIIRDYIIDILNSRNSIVFNSISIIV